MSIEFLQRRISRPASLNGARKTCPTNNLNSLAARTGFSVSAHWPILFIFCFLVTPLADAALYKCTDAKNRLFYQDKPCQDLTTEKLPSHLSQLSGKSEKRFFLWKAAGAKGNAYLLGSVHFGSQEWYPLPARITETFKSSDVLVVEANANNLQSSDAAKKLTQLASYSEGTNLEEHVKPATWRRLMEKAKKLGVAEEKLRPQKPWLAMLTLTAEALKQAGYSPELGIDQSFIRETGTQKPVIEMESVELQLQLFDKLTPQEQEQMLLQSLQELDRGVEIFKEIEKAWKNGDSEAIDLITRQSFDSGPVGSKLYKIIFEERNTAMTNKIDELMQDGRTYFIVVGAAHLAGDQGILKQLETKGYRVTQP